MLQVSEKAIVDAMRACADFMGERGFCYAISHDGETIGSGTWVLDPINGFAVTCSLLRDDKCATIELRGKTGEFIRHAIGPVSIGDVVRFTSGLVSP